MTIYTENDFSQWERFYRANVLSALSGYKAAMLIGTSNAAGNGNLALFQNVVHLGANPALIGLINRPEAATPHTLNNIRHTGWYTLNAVTQKMNAQAHQTSAKYAAETDEFAATALQKTFHENWAAPAVKESPVQALLKLVEIVPISYNQTFFIIGEVKAFVLADGLLQQDGFVDMAKAEMLCTTGLDGYALPSLLQRFAFAKPELPVRSL